jgi:hypothetical protein
VTILARRLEALPLLVALTGLTGCFDIAETIQLNADLSGTATVSMGVNMEGMILVGAQLKKQMQGGEGDLTEEEIAAARKEFLEENKGESKFDQAEFDAKKKALEESLPEGVTLKSINFNDSDPLLIKVEMTFAFDHVSKLAQIELPEDEAQQGPGPSNPIQKPFEGLVVEEEGDTLVIRIEKPLNPASKPDEGEAEGEAEGPPAGAMPPGLEGAIEKVMEGGLRVAYRIESPFEVVESNATDVKEGALEWNYDMKALKKLEEEGAEDPSPRATYKR